MLLLQIKGVFWCPSRHRCMWLHSNISLNVCIVLLIEGAKIDSVGVELILAFWLLSDRIDFASGIYST